MPEWVYHHQVDEKEYKSTRFAPGRSVPSFRKREEAAACRQQSYRTGQKVTVHCDFADPSRAVLDRARHNEGSKFP